MEQVKPKTLEINVSAPLFKVYDIFEREVDLESYKGQKVFIGFFRHKGCPFCNMRVHKLINLYGELKAKGMEMIFFFESPKNVILNSTFHSGITPIPTISDPEKIWYNNYGLEEVTPTKNLKSISTLLTTYIKAKINSLPANMPKDGESLDTLPAEFLLDEQLIIRKLYYSKTMADRMDLRHVIDFANQPSKVPAI